VLVLRQVLLDVSLQELRSVHVAQVTILVLIGTSGARGCGRHGVLDLRASMLDCVWDWDVLGAACLVDAHGDVRSNGSTVARQLAPELRMLATWAHSSVLGVHVLVSEAISRILKFFVLCGRLGSVP